MTRKLKIKIDKEEHAKNLKRKLPQINKKKTRRKAARVGRSIRVKTLHQSSVVNLPGEHRETCVTTREDLSHAVDALSEPDNRSDVRGPRVDPP